MNKVSSVLPRACFSLLGARDATRTIRYPYGVRIIKKSDAETGSLNFCAASASPGFDGRRNKIRRASSTGEAERNPSRFDSEDKPSQKTVPRDERRKKSFSRLHRRRAEVLRLIRSWFSLRFPAKKKGTATKQIPRRGSLWITRTIFAKLQLR